MVLDVDEHGIEVLKKAGEYVSPGDNTKTQLRIRPIPTDLQPPTGSKLILNEDTTANGYFVSILRYYDGGDPITPGALLGVRTLYFSDRAHCKWVAVKEGLP